jgi:hypothetical protein
MNELPLPWPLNREEWRPLPECDFYDVSSLGRVRSWRARCGKRSEQPVLLSPTVGRLGYASVMLTIADGITRRVAVHRMVASAFLNIDAGPVVRHLDGQPSDSSVNNLSIGTHRENTQDAIRHGTFNHGEEVARRFRGERAPKGRLDRHQVQEIVSRLADGERPSELAICFKVTHAAICSIRDGRSWGWLTGIGNTVAA